ncbi:MAG TPA: DUF4376 domain-containing protein [Methanosarcina sp.]|nr:DUF4376 domain-containing protein [Methanosarcina sp.]
MITLYSFDRITGEYKGSFTAPVDPLDKKPIIMSFSTDQAPPTVSTNQRAVFLTVDGLVPLNYKLGVWKVVPDYRGTTYWLPDGTEVNINELNVVPPKRSFNYRPISLKEAQDSKWNEIKRARSAQEFGTFDWNGHTFDADPTSQSRIMLAIMGAQMAIASGQNWSVDWRLSNNDLITLSATDMISVGEAMGANTTAAHEHANQLRTLIEDATTKEEVEAIVW